VAGGKMKETGTTHWLRNTGATNGSGFTGLPGGYISNNSSFSFGSGGFWWNSTEQDIETRACSNYLHWKYITITTAYHYGKVNGLSVRCIKD